MLGKDPETGLDVTAARRPLRPLRPARRGQRGARSRSAPACPRASHAGRRRPASMALGLLSLPREVGVHPETGKPITAGLGRYGPFVLHDGTYANLEAGRGGVRRRPQPRGDADRRRKPQRGPGRGASAPIPAGRSATIPTLGGPVTVRERPLRRLCQRTASVNATIPSDIDPGHVTLEEAVALIDARAAEGGGKTKSRAEEAAKAATADKRPKTKAAKADRRGRRGRRRRRPRPEGGREESRRDIPVEGRQSPRRRQGRPSAAPTHRTQALRLQLRRRADRPRPHRCRLGQSDRKQTASPV